MTLRPLLALLTTALLVAPGAAPAAPPPRFDVQVGETQYGIPHIVAKDFAGIGYGYARALAENTVCTVADSYMTVNAQRSRFLGPDAKYDIRGNGSSATNLNSDLFYQRIIDDKRIERLLAQQPPLGPRQEVRDGVRGYVAGWNAWLRDTGGSGGIPDPTCRGEQWVRPITEMDVWRRFYQLALLASAGVAIDGIASAQPPTPAASGSGSAARARDTQALDAVRALAPGEIDARLGGLGSNAYGLGRDVTASGNGMVYGNPHFPWQGSERFFQSHITVPGKADVMGGSLLGVPLILIGTTRGMAWSHTVSTARRFVPIELKLVSGSPTTYLVDGQPKEMKRDKVTVEARRPDGSIGPVTRTLYSTAEGDPILVSLLGLPIFPWSTNTAFALGDANDDNFGRLFNHFFEMNMAQTVDDVDRIERKYQGIPWVNTIAADSAGNAYYADIGSIPHVTEDKRVACETPFGAALDQAQRVIVLDGSRSACGFGSDPDAAAPGILGPSREPSLRRSDYVQNENDSYWLSNPRQLLEGYPRIIGDERTARSLRTRVGIRMIEDRLAGSDGEPGNRFTLENLTKLAFGNRVYGAELFKADLVAFCRTSPVVVTQSGPVDVSGACPVLEKWNGREDLDARGALLFRRFMARLNGAAPVGLPYPGNAFRTPFDPNDPVNTPAGLNTALPTVSDALGGAVRDLEGAKIPLDAPLGEFAYVTRQGKRIPIQGGPGPNGIFNVITPVWDPKQGYTEVVHGSSYIQAVELTPGCPKVRTLVTYSQSTNPESPHFADQTPLFSAKRFNAPPFCAADVQRDPSLTVTRYAERPAGRIVAEARTRDGRGRTRPRVEVVLARGARVRVAILRGRRVVRRIARSGKAGRAIVMAPRLARGRYRVRLEARRGSRREVVGLELRRR